MSSNSLSISVCLDQQCHVKASSRDCPKGRVVAACFFAKLFPLWEDRYPALPTQSLMRWLKAAASESGSLVTSCWQENHAPPDGEPCGTSESLGFGTDLWAGLV